MGEQASRVRRVPQSNSDSDRANNTTPKRVAVEMRVVKAHPRLWEGKGRAGKRQVSKAYQYRTATALHCTALLSST